MDKTGGFVLVLISLILVLVVGGVSAYFIYGYYIGPRVVFEEGMDVTHCIDTDGLEILVKGYVNYTYFDVEDQEEVSGMINDVCDYSSYGADPEIGLIREGYCDNQHSKQVNVWMTCGSGNVCRAGRCVSELANESICQDSDGGKSIQVAGEIVGVGGSGMDSCWIGSLEEGSLTDSCDRTDCFVYEYYCDGNSKAYELVNCEKCVDGACV